ncbi:DUF2240 family protein [Halovenus rubra]|uniref:DUF2240 family protein n=2 Tax=Halovenus rubra TaxID=869890 RepID=A0ACC7E4L2_9EURY|nr:DUF2240 family protein [Halovenus rubra]
MSLRRAVAAPFRHRGVTSMSESEFIVALSLDRDWFSPDQAKRLVDVAATEGLIERTDGEVTISFDLHEVEVSENFEPDESILRQRTTFERVLGRVVDNGVDKQTAVADINKLQSELAISVEAAAVLYAQRREVDVSEVAERGRQEVGQ